MVSLPGGTVTLLFTDIEGSTPLVRHLSDRYAEVQAEHHRLLAGAIAAAGGAVVDTQGDGCFAAFPGALAAIRAAVAAQRALADHPWPEGIAVRVRMGLHTGEPLPAGTRYVGLAVHLAARIGAAGHGGQVLLSAATADLVRDRLPADLALRELGAHRLKDFAMPVPLFQLLIPGQSPDFPPLKTPGNVGASAGPGAASPPRPGGDPSANAAGVVNPFTYGKPVADPDRFIGRREVLAQVFDRLRNVAFESTALVGERRIGKTSLLQQVAHPEVRRARGLDPARYLALHVDLQLVDAAMTPERLWRWILGRLAHACPDLAVARAVAAQPAAVPLDNFALEEVFDTLDERGLYLVLLLDEFEQLTANPHFGADFFYGLRSLAIHHHLALVTASRRDLVELCHSEEVRSSPFFNIFATVRVPLLTAEEAADLVARALAGTGIAFDAAELAALGGLAGRHPYLLQMAGHLLFAAHARGDAPATRRTALERGFRAEVAPHLGDAWQHATDPERAVLLVLACLAQAGPNNGRGVRLEEVRSFYDHASRGLAQLARRGLVIEQGETYGLLTPVFGPWILGELAGSGVGPGAGKVHPALPAIGPAYQALLRDWLGDPQRQPAIAALLERALRDGAGGDQPLGHQ